MSVGSVSDVSLVQDEELLRKMWQETEDYGKKKEIRSHMYKIREARLKDFYGTSGNESSTNSESRQHSTITTRSSGGLKGSELSTRHADNLIDHSFLSLKSKEIRDSESPTKDSYKITETKKIDDRDWNIVESNESSKDGKKHTTSRIATTSGKQDVDGGEMNYAAKSEQKASVFKDGDDKNFTKSVGASSQNVIKQEAFGGDENNKFYSTSTTSSSSSKFTSEQRSTTGDIDLADYQQQPNTNVKSSRMMKTSAKDDAKVTTTAAAAATTKTQEETPSVRNSQQITRTVYTENIPNEFKNHPNYTDGNTKVTTETKTLPDGSTVTTTRYETKGATQHSTQSQNSSTHVSTSSSNQQQINRIQIVDENSRIGTVQKDDDNTRIQIIKDQESGSKMHVDDSSNQTRIIRSERIEDHRFGEDDIKRRQDLAVLGRSDKNVENVEVVITKQLPVQETRTVTTTVTKNINTSQGKDEAVRDNIVERRGVHQEFRPSEEHISKTTTVTKNINTTYDNQQVASDHFLNTERNETTKSIKKPEDAKPIIEPAGKHTETIEIEIIRQQEPQISQKKTPKLIEEPVNYTKEPRAKDEPKYEQPERRKPITPGKSEWDDRATPTDGQYDTTYRTDYVPRRISVEVSPTHDAFARSLRSVSPDRVSKIGSTRSLRTNSTTSLRKSPERAGNKTRSSPANSRPISPSKKAKSPEKYDSKPRHGSPPYHDYRTPKMVSDVQHATNTDTITKRKKTTDVDSNTLTRRKDAEGPRSRSVSPTSTTSDFEFVRHRNDIVTDLDIDDTKVLSKQTLEDRPTNLELSKKPQKITEKSLTSPLTEFRKTPTSPTKRSPTKETHEPDKSKKPFRRTDTYEERCKEILGISNGQDTHRKASLPTTPGDRIQSPTKPKKFIETSPNKSKDESPRRKSPEKKPSEFPSQIRKSPQKEPLEPYPEKVKDVKRGPGVAEFPAQIRKSPEKQPLEPYPGKPKDVKKRPSVAEFPAQIRKSPEKQPLEPYPEKRKETKKGPSISEFPGQIRKSPEKQPLEPYPEKLKDAKKGPSVAEFPSQIRKSSEREPLEPYPDKIKYAKKAPGVSEFPAQIKKSPSKEPLEPYPEKRKDVRTPSDVAEFPSQIRKSPEKQPLAPYPEKPKDAKRGPSVAEFPSQIRKSPEKQPLEPYPEKPKDAKRGPSVAEFPSQIRKSSEREPLEPYPEKPKETKKGPSVSEFPGQIRKSPEKQPLEPYPEKPKDAKRAPGVSEFPAQIKKLPSREPLEPYQEKPKHSKDSPTIQEFPRKSPQKEEHSEDVKKRPQHETPRDSKPSDLYAEILRGRSESPEREPLEYFDKPLERSSSRVSLDDLQLVKTDRVSLDDLPSIGKPQRKISLSDLDQKQPDDYVDNFMTSERIDSEITLKKYKDDSIGPVIEVPPPVSSKIDVKKMKKRARNDKKSKIGRTTTIRGSDTESSTDEEDDIEDQIIEDICDVVECVETIATRRETSKLKAKPKGPQVVEDFVTVTKAQLLDSSSSRIPVEEVIHTKKFINELSKDEEEDRKTVLTKTVLTTTEFIKPNKTVKKDSPKKSPITNDVKRRTEIKITPKTPEMKKIATIVTRRIDDKGTYDTEYTDQYKRKVPKGPSKVTTAKITLTANEKKPQIKKKVEIVRKIEGVKSQAKRYTSPEKKPETKLPTKSKIATTTSSTAKTQKITVTEAQPARRHVVSTIINIKPKVKPETISKTIHKTTVTRTITAPKTITTKITPKSITGKPKKKLLPNGYASTDDEEEEEDASEIEVKVKETLKTDRNQQHRKKSPFTTKTTGETKKCITTKSILIENAVADEREIIVDLRRSKSSREGTPDRICPYPVSSNADLGRPRYPDRVIEPDDAGFQRPKQRISDIPLDEMEDVTESERITEVRQEENNRRQDRKTEVESTDECLLSVNEKVNKFLTTAEQVTNKPIDAKPAPKVERPKLEIEESLKEDECLLSVSDKVNKFIATAEQLSSTTKTTTTATKDKIVNVVESEENVRRSVSPEKKMDASPKRKTPDRSSPRIPPLDQEETPKTSRRLSKDDAKPAVSSPTGARLRSTETIKKAKALFENISERDMARQMDILSRPSVFEGRKLKKAEDEKEEEEEVKVARTRLTYDEVKRSASPEKVLRSDWPSKEDPHYMSPLDRTIKEHTRRNQVDDDNDDEIEHLRSSRDSSVDRDVPHYMLPLDRSVRERSPHKDNLKQLDDIMSRSFGHDEVDVVKTSASTTTTSTKFGVTLRRTDSGRVITGGHRRSSAASSTTGGDTQQVDEDLNVEEIFDLEFLEKLLETIVGYDIRRRIRAQIRLVKRSIEENAVVESSIKKRITSSPTKDVPPKRTVIDKKKQSEELSKQITQLSEYQSSYSSNRKTSMEYTETRSKSSSPSRPMEKRSRAPTKSPSPLRKTGATELDGGDGTKKTTASPRIFQTDLKKTKPLSKTTMVDEKPEWITQRTLRKVSETSAPVKRSVTSTTTTKKQITTKTIDHEKPTDVITSSYGVGPMDENGSPLFGLKALRAQNKTEKTKVQGTVIRSHYHSENGGEPEGEISITKFSTDPEDLGTKNVTRDSKGAGGLTSVTTTQKFGYKGTPPLKKITTGATDKNQVETTKTNVRTGSKVTRRGSVKEMSQKFIENAVDTLKNERQSSYPKAGLILRTSSFKDTTSNGTNSNTSREGSPATQELHQRVVTTTVKKSTTSTASDGRKGDTFLSNKSKVTGVQDVISRMRNDTAEIEVEETAEDAEARNLLNKFIGAQVLLSGMESHAASKSARTTATSTASATSSSGDVKRTTKITTTTTNSESSTPNTVTRTFTHPITPELLNTIWDEATLKLLLEQSTNYEDRRIIRARLRDIMAEQEACAELVEKASNEAVTQGSNTVHEDGAAVQDEENEESEEEESDGEEDDDDASTVKITAPQPDLIMQTNPAFDQPANRESPPIEKLSEEDEYPTTAILNEKANRFNNKKLKMKRANTIDIPKPLKYYEYDDDEDDDSENEDANSNNHHHHHRRSNYLALRGPIRVGKLNSETKKVPEFEPKTESDRKFMAFLQKQSENSANKNTSIWCKQPAPPPPAVEKKNNVSKWNNKFGDIKSNFEKVQVSNSVNSARNFWKSADDAAGTVGRVSNFGPKISRASARNLQQMFEEKQKQNQMISENKNVITGSLKVETKNKNMTTVAVTQPNSINQFSHAPMSAFKPVGRKIEEPAFLKPKPIRIVHPKPIKTTRNEEGQEEKQDDDIPLYLYSPKQFSPTEENTSPVNFGPIGKNFAKSENGGGRRALSIAAAKFENFNNKIPPDYGLTPVRKMSKEKIVIPPVLLQQQSQRSSEKLTAPYLVKSLVQKSSPNSVRKLSGQYDNLSNRDLVFGQPPHQSRVFVPGENYTIQYGKPVVGNVVGKPHQQQQQPQLQTKPQQQQPKVYNAEFTITQHRYDRPELESKLFQSSEQQQQEKPKSKRSEQEEPKLKRYDEFEEYRGDEKMESGALDAQMHNELQRAQIRNQQLQTEEQKHQQYIKYEPNTLKMDENYKRETYAKPEVYHEKQDLVKKQDDHQYTSNFHFKPMQMQSQPQQTQKITFKNSNSQNSSFDQYYEEPKKEILAEMHPGDKENYYFGEFQNYQVAEGLDLVTKPSMTTTTTTPRYDRQTSGESVKEYTAVSSKVMSGPVGQQAVTVQQNSPKNRDQHDMQMYLKASLQKFSAEKSPPKENRLRESVIKSPESKPIKRNIIKEEPPPPLTLYNNVKPKPSLRINDKPLSLESLEINERGESVLTSKFHIPLVKSPPMISGGGGGHELSRSESWHQICQKSQSPSSIGKPSPRASPNSRSVARSKSSHTLALPKQFEAGMSKNEMQEKKRTMEAYFGGTNNMQKEQQKKSSSSSINRVKTSQKLSAQRQSLSSSTGIGLCRSKTLPDIVCLEKMDDKNIDAIFEDLFNSRTTATRTFTEAPITTTTSQTTTRVTSQQQQQQQQVKKPMSPFAKFRQLDKQNSLNSPPSTPKSPGGGPLFKFTDTSLTESANTVKQRLLRWCQIKTKEYENIQLDNFSTSWADGMAFCALIHHFLPDAFDYKVLNPKNRRHNFTLAFRVAEEKADIAPLLDVDDMVLISKPDWKCVFTYVQSIYRRFKDED